MSLSINRPTWCFLPRQPIENAAGHSVCAGGGDQPVTAARDVQLGSGPWSASVQAQDCRHHRGRRSAIRPATVGFAVRPHLGQLASASPFGQGGGVALPQDVKDKFRAMTDIIWQTDKNCAYEVAAGEAKDGIVVRPRRPCSSRPATSRKGASPAAAACPEKRSATSGRQGQIN